MKVIRRVFRTLHVNGQQVPNVLFLDLNVDILEALTYPDHEQGVSLKMGGYPLPEKRRQVSRIPGGMESPFWEREVSYIGETNTENTNRKFSTESSSLFQIKRKSGNRFLMGL